MLRLTGDVAAMVASAEKDGSMESLLSSLKYLNAWGLQVGEPNNRVIVEAYVYDREPQEGAGLHFLGDDEVTVWLKGGLVHHKSSKSWGIHT